MMGRPENLLVQVPVKAPCQESNSCKKECLWAHTNYMTHGI